MKRLWNWLKQHATGHSYERCSECKQPITRLEWGGRLHTTSRGSRYVHGIDHIAVMNADTMAEKREAMAKWEARDKWMADFKARLDNA